MKMANFKPKKTEIPKGIQIILDFGNYHLSIIQNQVSYGARNGLYEIAVFNSQDGVASEMTQLPGITNVGDTVKGNLTESEVDTIIKKLYAITRKQPVQI